VLSYLFCLLGIGVPLLSAEIVVGTHGRGSPVSSLLWTASVAGRSRLWAVIGVLATVAAFLLLTLCLLVAGWALVYAFHQQLGTFAAMPTAGVGQFLQGQLEEPLGLLAAQAGAALAVAAVSMAGIRRGVGVYAWIAVPLVVWLLGVLIDYALDFGDLEAAGRMLFTWQPLDFDRASFLAALGHALFTLSVGVAIGLTYGAYAPEKVPVVRCVLAVTVFDFVVAVALGVALYPVLIEAQVLPARDFALLFAAVPLAFGSMPFGDFYGALVFVFVVIVVLGSAIALLEPIVSLLEEQLRLGRRAAGPLAIGLACLSSIVLALAIAQGDRPLEIIDVVISLGLLPLAMVLLAIFVGWRVPRAILRGQLSREPEALFALWYFLLRYVAVPVVAVAWLWMYLVP